MARTIWRVHRFELIALTVFAILLCAAALIMTQQLDAAVPPAGCLGGGDIDPTTAAAQACSGALSRFDSLSSLAGQLWIGFAILPLAAGAILGAGLVGQEVERRTAQLAWSLAPSRRRWLFEGMAVLVLILLAWLVPAAISGHLLEGATHPTTDPTASLRDLGLRGITLVMRGLATLGVGVLAGAILGRVLPALLVSVLVGTLLLFAVQPVTKLTQNVETIGPMGSAVIGQSILSGDAYQASDGRLFDFESASAQAPVGLTDSQKADWLASNFTWVGLGIPGQRYPAVDLTLGTMLGLVMVSTMAAALIVVDRRRPS